jgi:hypothetical protein
MLVPLLTLTVVALLMYAGFVKLAARFLRYGITWTSSFLFALIVYAVVIVARILSPVVAQPLAIMVGQTVVLLFGLVILGGWFFSGRATDVGGQIVGWRGSIRLSALAFSLMFIIGIALLIILHAFHLQPAIKP